MPMALKLGLDVICDGRRIQLDMEIRKISRRRSRSSDSKLGHFMFFGSLSNDDTDPKDDGKELYFTVEFRRCLDLFSASIDLRACSSSLCNVSIKFQKKIRKICLRRSCSAKYKEMYKEVQCTKAKKCTQIYNARALLLFSLNLWCDVLVAVVVVVCLSSVFKRDTT